MFLLHKETGETFNLCILSNTSRTGAASGHIMGLKSDDTTCIMVMKLAINDTCGWFSLHRTSWCCTSDVYECLL